MLQHQHDHLGTTSGSAHMVWHQLALALMALAAVAALVVALRRGRRGESGHQGQVTRSAPVGLFASPASAALAGLMAAAAGIHLAVIREHFLEDPALGWFFTVLAVAQLGYAALIVLRPSRLLLALGAASNVAVVALWIYTRTVGIPFGIDGGEAEAFGLADILSAIVELSAAALALYLIRARTAATRRAAAPRRLQPAHAGWALMVVSLSGAVAGIH